MRTTRQRTHPPAVQRPRTTDAGNRRTAADLDALRDMHANFDQITAMFKTFDELRADVARQQQGEHV